MHVAIATGSMVMVRKILETKQVWESIEREENEALNWLINKWNTLNLIIFYFLDRILDLNLFFAQIVLGQSENY